jgi:hypothetical protein
MRQRTRSVTFSLRQCVPEGQEHPATIAADPVEGELVAEVRSETAGAGEGMKAHLAVTADLHIMVARFCGLLSSTGKRSEGS